MTREEMRIMVARNVNQLSGTDESTFVDSRLTDTAINTKLNDIYLEEVFPLLSDKFPEDFYQTTKPKQTYTATGTVDSSSTSTTLVATTSIFTSDMETNEYTVYNSTDDETREISSYTSATTVTVDSAIDDDWDGDTIYVLGAEYTLGGETTDAKEIVGVGIKYASTDDYFRECEARRKSDILRYGNEAYNKYSPKWYRTTVDVSGDPMMGFGIRPYPDAYNGKYIVTYVEQPPSLSSDSDEPRLHVAGISEVIINGTTAWALRVQKNYDEAATYTALYEKGKIDLVRNYKPRTRSGPTKVRTGGYVESLNKRKM